MQVLPDEEDPIVDEDRLVSCGGSPFIREAVVVGFLCEFESLERKSERFFRGGRLEFEKSNVVSVERQHSMDKFCRIGHHE